MDWITTVNGLIALITGLCGLVGTGIGAFFAIKNFIGKMKEKSSNEVFLLILQMADSAMKEAEASALSGKDKKQLVIDSVKAGCKAASIDIDPFMDQLSDYIDTTIAFVNEMNKNKK